MFVSWGRIVYRARYTVIAGFVTLMAVFGIYGIGYADRLSQEGWFDDTSESVAGSVLADDTFGRDTDSDVIALYTVPEGKSVDDPDIRAKVTEHLARVAAEHPEQIQKVDSYWDSSFASSLADKSKQHAFASIGLHGDGGTETLRYYDEIKDKFAVDGTTVELAGLQPIANGLNDGMQQDIARAELIALPLVALLLFFVFGGVVGAILPVSIGGLTIIGSQGIMRLITEFTDVNAFASAVVTLIGLGLAIDYGLFTVSRFREEVAEGRSTEDAVQITVATAGRTIVFSATIIVICLGGLLIFPQGFLKSVAYGAISTVVLAATLSISVLPAILGVLGKRVDMLGIARFSRTKTNAAIDAGYWSRLANWAMKRPSLLAYPIILFLLALTIPFGQIEFGGLSEKYLSPESSARIAQEKYDALFPEFRTEPLKIVVRGADNTQLSAISQQANRIPGLTGRFKPDEKAKDGVNVLRAGLVDKTTADDAIGALRAIPAPAGVQILVAGTPALERDSIHGLIDRLPLLLVILVIASFVMMFLAFGSFVLPVKAILVSALSLAATLGVLTWIFFDGHGSEWLNFTPGPLMFAVLILIVTIVFGLSTDYEIFLMSRMVEAREKGSSTQESIRFGIAHTGGIITAAALILIVVTGAFGLSDIVLMKYIAYGMIAALILDATIIRMLLVPAVMKIIGDACWWAPGWAKRLHNRIGLSESGSESLPSEPELVTART